ncbi:MAG: SpoIIE family protein phosphatase [Flavobacteriales bacterium]|nr:SpoIIE family protein phosphatase [Flavobacteriales bacterium]
MAVSNIVQNIVGNLKTRILLIVFLTILGITSFFTIFGYFNQLANYEEAVLNQLMGIVSGLGADFNGDQHQKLTEKYQWRDDISAWGEDPDYDALAKTLATAQHANELSSRIFTMFYDEEERIFLYAVSSDTTEFTFRHKYEMYPNILLDQMNEGGKIETYDSETGEWISAFYPIRNSNGDVVGLIQADVEFGAFKKMAFDQFKQQALISFIVILVIAGILYPYVRSVLKEDEDLKLELYEQKELIEERNQLIEERNKDLQESLNYAGQIQETMLPSKAIFNKILPNSFVFYQPKEKVSGDFYWIRKTEKHILVALSDCSGHGIPGALMSMIGLSKLTSIFNHHPEFEPHQIMNQMDIEVTESLTVKSYRTETTDSMEVGICKIDPINKKVVFAGGMVDLFVVRNGEIIEHKGDRFPVAGGDAYEKGKFDQTIIKAEEGDAFYMFSDGYADQFGGPKQKKFLNKNFKKLLLDIHGKTGNEKHELLHQEFNNWKGDLEQLDDVLVIGFTF